MLVKTIRKAIVAIVLVITLFSIALTANSLSNLKNEFENSAQRLIHEHAQREANRISTALNQDMAIARSLSNIMEGIATYPSHKREPIQRLVMKEVLRDNPEYMAVFMSWSLNHIDSTWNRPNGRQRFNQYYSDGAIAESINLTDTAFNSELVGLFYSVKESGKGTLSNPYLFEAYDNASQELLLATSPCYPIFVESQFVGIIGLDISLDYYTKLSEVDLYENAYAILLSNDGKIISHPKQSWENTLISNLDYLDYEGDLSKSIANGNTFTFTTFDSHLGESAMVGFAPVEVRDGSPWSVAVVVPTSAIMAPLKRRLLVMASVTAVFLVLLTFTTRKIGMKLVKSLDKANAQLKKLALGDVNVENELKLTRLDRNLEIGHSVNLLMGALRQKADFSLEIGKGNLDADLKKTSEDDLLGYALITMRNNLKQAIMDTQEALKKAVDKGQLDIAIRTDGKEGAWLELSISINRLLQSIWDPLKRVNQIIEDMAAGDLRSRYNENASGEVLELTQNLNNALDELNELIKRVQSITSDVESSALEMISSSKEMSNSSAEITSSIAEISHGAQNQVNKVDEASRLIENMRESSEGIGRQSDIITQSANEVNERSRKGLEMVNDLLEGMQEVNQLSKLSEQAMQGLEAQSKEISVILDFITEIADQTNLLALNASIEAAQAGDSGRGFAVIAEEIRKLAENSRGSVNEIKSLVTQVKLNTSEVSQSVTKMRSRVEKSEAISQTASDEFKRITEASDKNLELSEAIKEMNRAQSDNIQSIVSLSEAVVVIAEESAAGTEQVASASEQVSTSMNAYLMKNQNLSVMASELSEKLKQFKIKSDISSFEMEQFEKWN